MQNQNSSGNKNIKQGNRQKSSCATGTQKYGGSAIVSLPFGVGFKVRNIRK